MGESMLKYIIKCPWFKMELKMRFFKTKTQESRLFKFHFETTVLFIGFILSWTQNLKNFGIIIILLNLISQYDVQKYVLIRKFNEINLCEVIT